MAGASAVAIRTSVKHPHEFDIWLADGKTLRLSGASFADTATWVQCINAVSRSKPSDIAAAVAARPVERTPGTPARTAAATTTGSAGDPKNLPRSAPRHRGTHKRAGQKHHQHHTSSNGTNGHADDDELTATSEAATAVTPEHPIRSLALSPTQSTPSGAPLGMPALRGVQPTVAAPAADFDDEGYLTGTRSSTTPWPHMLCRG